MTSVKRPKSIEDFVNLVRHIPKFTDLKIEEITKELARVFYARTVLVAGVTTHFSDNDVGGINIQAPSVKDILAIKPMRVFGESYSIRSLVGQHIQQGFITGEQNADFICDVMRLYKKSKNIELGSLEDLTAAEFLSRLPVMDSDRRYRMIELDKNCVVYFMDARIMVIANRGTPANSNTDVNYFIKCIDIGAPLQSYLKGEEISQLDLDGTCLGEVRETMITVRTKYMHGRTKLWEHVRVPVPYTWLIEAPYHQRRTSTFDIVFRKAPQRQYSIESRVWSNYRRIFGMPDLNSHFKPKAKKEAAV